MIDNDDQPPHAGPLAGLLQIAGGGREELRRRLLIGGGPGGDVDDRVDSGEGLVQPSPVITSTPLERDIGTTSYPRDSRMSTMCRPTRPVAPATAILVLFCISVSLEWIAPLLRRRAAAREM